MRKLLKWIGIVLGTLVGLIVLFFLVVYVISDVHFNRAYDVQVKPITIPTDPASIAYGEHIANIRGCKGCYGEDLSGQVLIGNKTLVGVFAMSNLTGGKGSGGTITLPQTGCARFARESERMGSRY